MGGTSSSNTPPAAKIGLPIKLTTIPYAPPASISWKPSTSTTSTKFSARNGHASCVFKNKIWVTGGRTDVYRKYNLLYSLNVADVWWSNDGATFYQQSSLTGDFWAQNDDARQPGSVAPWYERFGHSLTPVDTSGSGINNLMILMGGYAPDPMNDIWASEDGSNWVFCGHAPWQPRGWHGATVFNGKLFVGGGSPLNNEVWFADIASIHRQNRTTPLTRSMYNYYSFSITWEQLPSAPWAPRVGMGFISHWYFNVSANQGYADSVERLAVIGGEGWKGLHFVAMLLTAPSIHSLSRRVTRRAGFFAEHKSISSF